MAYSPGYQYDVFLSYAREDNRDRWVDALRSAVADETEEITGRPVSVFQDTSLRAGDDFPAEIADAASNSAVMIAVLSPSYLNSSWCRKELEIFLAAFAKSEPMGRLVPLLKRPIGSESRSELIDRFQQFPFLDETQAPLSPGSDLWRSRIREVARAIEKMLQRVRYGAAEESRGDKAQTSEAPAAPADASLSQSPDTTSTTGADLTAVENTEGRSTEPHSESERLSAQLRPAETLVSAFLENLGFTLDEESKRTMSLAGNLGAQRIPDRRDVSTSLILFALCESGWKGIPDSQTDAAGRTVVDRVRSAGQYQNVLEGYFNKQKPRIIFDEGAPTVTGLTANATSLLREACDLARSDGTRAVRPGTLRPHSSA